MGPGGPSGGPPGGPRRPGSGTGPRTRGGQGPFSQLPVLEGLAQVIGLALGAPEFQRR
jgi:hypothetical protein